MTALAPELTSSYPLADLSAEKLLQLMRTAGYDAALAILHRAVCESPIHAPMIAQVDALLRQTPPPFPADTTVAVIPGALYRENPETGADGGRFIDIVQQLGMNTARIPTKSLGTLEDNSRIILEWLQNHRDRNVVLVSFSKGSADVKMALRNPASQPAFARVIGWLSVGGILHGTPLIAWLRRHRLRFFFVRMLMRLRRLPIPALLEMGHGSGTTLDAPTCIPAHLRLIHLISFPTARDLSLPIAQRAFDRLSPLGLNDAGGLMLHDLQRFPGAVYPLLHTDHYLRKCGELPKLLAALLHVAAGQSR